MFETFVHDGILVLSGDLGSDNVATLEAQLTPLLLSSTVDGEPSIVDCDALEIEDGLAMASLVRLLKIAVRGGRSFILRGAGQMLAHNIYRAHLMDNGVVLQQTRMNEPSA